MTAAGVRLWARLLTGAAGVTLWQGLGPVAWLCDPNRTDAVSFSIGRRMVGMQRNIGDAGGLGRRTGPGRIANILLAIAVTSLMAAGIAKAISLIVAKQGGAA
jgi:hypothetical protein